MKNFHKKILTAVFVFSFAVVSFCMSANAGVLTQDETIASGSASATISSHHHGWGGRGHGGGWGHGW